MIRVIFKTETRFRSSPNKLISLNNDYSLCNDMCAFGTLSKTNIFIGENNSGKSRFLRQLFATNYLSIDDDGIDKLSAALRIYVDFDDIDDKYGVSKFDLIYKKVMVEQRHYYNRETQLFNSLEELSRAVVENNKYYFPTVRGLKDYKFILDKKLKSFSKSAESIQNKDPIHHFISLLNLDKNGLEAFDIYREITLHEYFPKGAQNIITGGDLYGKIKSMLLGTEQDRQLIAEFQLFLHDNFFTEYETVQLIPYESEKVLYVKIGNDERAIYDWGDGTQQLIIILFTLFIHKDAKDKLFFIEEPEIYLHPGILRKFIEVINSDIFPNHQYFITTHSNVILDTSADTDVNMSIFKFTKNKNDTDNSNKFVIEQCNNGDTSLLNVLGVRNSSVFLSNCSIWVEGITDRLYLKHFLNLYFKKYEEIGSFRENIDYTFIEYGGNNLVHFNFDKEDSTDNINAKYINNRIFLIADNDNTATGTKKAERKAHLKNSLGEHFHELSVMEVENLLSQKTIEQILTLQNPKLEETIQKKFSRKLKYEDKKLGRYIDDLFKASGMKKYSADSGTIKDKLAFCKTAIDLLTDYDMLTDEAKDLVEKIVTFIESNN